MKTGSIPVVRELLENVSSVSPFSGSQYPYPVNQSLFGELNLEILRRRAESSDGSLLKEDLSFLLAMAEAVEASQPDKGEFFINDRELRARLVRLNSTDAWALMWGKDDERTAGLASRLQRKNFQVYTVLTGDNNVSPSLRVNKQYEFLGSRQTSAVYFYQALVRCAHIYERVLLADAHETGKFLQAD